MTEIYDSTSDTMQHIEIVRDYLGRFIDELHSRAVRHDASKLQEPEKEIYDEFTPKLKEMTYGSDEYKNCLRAMGPALQHHYSVNSHHPEHYRGGLDEMDFLDVLEMLADWKAATLRHADGDILKSLEINRVRFEMSNQLYNLLLNTVRRVLE